MTFLGYEGPEVKVARSKQAGREIIAAKHEATKRLGSFLTNAADDAEFDARLENPEVQEVLDDAVEHHMATVTDPKAKLIRALKVAWEQKQADGQTCSVCGDSIAKDPAGENPSTWHHTNGTSHDHEAKPGSDKEASGKPPWLKDDDEEDLNDEAKQLKDPDSKAVKRIQESERDAEEKSKGSVPPEFLEQQKKKGAEGGDNPLASEAKEASQYTVKCDSCGKRFGFDSSSPKCPHCGASYHGAKDSKTAGNPHPVGTPAWFEWEYDEKAPGKGPFEGVPRDLFPSGGVPLKGELTPEQEAWLKRRSSAEKTAVQVRCHSCGEETKVEGEVVDSSWVCPKCGTPASDYKKSAKDGYEQQFSPHAFVPAVAGSDGEKESTKCAICGHTKNNAFSKHTFVTRAERLESFRKGAPFAGYEDFDACVAANQDKDDPEAYCGKIKHQVEDGKESKTAAGTDHRTGVPYYDPGDPKGKYRVEVQVAGENTWHTNGMRFESTEDAKKSGGALAFNWTLVTGWRVVPDSYPKNETYEGSRDDLPWGEVVGE